jgi:hypothetical protein
MKSEDFFYASVRSRGGKVHRAVIDKKDGHLSISCDCPGSRNGRLRNSAYVLCQNEDSEIGWKLSNCGK